jgi:trimeric autotransporter adhesin
VAQNTGTGSTDYAAYLVGNVSISGNVSKGGGSFQIDHPLDPANKYLYHSFVESPDMMNIYNGVITLDAQGSVWIALPDYFEALNQDFRYQATSMGRPQPSLYVAREISGNRFRISGGKPGGKVSWQVTGIRHDAYADAYRIQVEVEKQQPQQGRYLHPELFGAPAEQAIGYPAPAAPTHAERARVLSPTAPPTQPQ